MHDLKFDSLSFLFDLELKKKKEIAEMKNLHLCCGRNTMISDEGYLKFLLLQIFFFFFAFYAPLCLPSAVSVRRRCTISHLCHRSTAPLKEDRRYHGYSSASTVFLLNNISHVCSRSL